MTAAFSVISMLLAGGGQELNAKGEALLHGGNDNEALLFFRRAAEAEPHLASAFFNQALAMADLRRKPNLRVQPTKKDVLDAVELALQLDPKMRSRAEVELPAVRTTFRGQRLIGRTIEKDTPAILQNITWRSRAGLRLDFLGDGTVRYWNRPELSEYVPRPSGTWTVQGGRVTVLLGRRTLQGGLDSDGVLTLEGLGRFFDW